MKKFMQGPWIQMLVYQSMSESDLEEENILSEWEKKYKPNIDDEGEYPGYYDYLENAKQMH